MIQLDESFSGSYLALGKVLDYDSTTYFSLLKNVPHNLTVLCSTCHDRIHQNQVKVSGYTQTSHGVKLMISIPDPNTVQAEKEKWQPLIHSLRAQQKSVLSIAKELGLTVYKVNQYLK